MGHIGWPILYGPYTMDHFSWWPLFLVNIISSPCDHTTKSNHDVINAKLFQQWSWFTLIGCHDSAHCCHPIVIQVFVTTINNCCSLAQLVNLISVISPSKNRWIFFSILAHPVVGLSEIIENKLIAPFSSCSKESGWLRIGFLCNLNWVQSRNDNQHNQDCNNELAEKLLQWITSCLPSQCIPLFLEYILATWKFQPGFQWNRPTGWT